MHAMSFSLTQDRSQWRDDIMGSFKTVYNSNVTDLILG